MQNPRGGENGKKLAVPLFSTLRILVAAAAAEIAPAVVLSESQGIATEDKRSTVSVAVAAQHLLIIFLFQ